MFASLDFLRCELHGNAERHEDRISYDVHAAAVRRISTQERRDHRNFSCFCAELAAQILSGASYSTLFPYFVARLFARCCTWTCCLDALFHEHYHLKSMANRRICHFLRRTREMRTAITGLSRKTAARYFYTPPHSPHISSACDRGEVASERRDRSNANRFDFLRAATNRERSRVRTGVRLGERRERAVRDEESSEIRLERDSFAIP